MRFIGPFFFALFIAIFTPPLVWQSLSYAERIAPRHLPISPAEVWSFVPHEQPPEYAEFYQPCPTKECVTRLLPLWKKAVDDYFENYTSHLGTAHTRSDLLYLFSDRLPASASAPRDDFLSVMRPWYPQFLANYTHLLEGVPGFGFEVPVGGRGLVNRPKIYSYLTENRLCLSRLGKLVLWIPYKYYVRGIEWLSAYTRSGDLEVIAGGLYYVVTFPGYAIMTSKTLVTLGIRLAKAFLE